MALIHMNGRVYDPTIGRFTAADPFIQSPYNTQSYNRYSYVINNPVNLIDPSGYIFGIGGWVKRKLKSFESHIRHNGWEYFKWGFIGGNPQVQHFVASNQFVQTVGYIVVGSLAGPLGVAGWSAYITDASGGSIGDIAKSAAISYISASISAGIGNEFGHDSSFLTAETAEAYTQATIKAAAHGFSQGTIAALQGQDFQASFISGFVSSSFSIGDDGFGEGTAGVITRTAIMATVGGTVSRLGGGKFANGAVTATFVHLFNAERIFDKKPTIGAGKSGTVKLKLDKNTIKQVYIDENGVIHPDKTVYIKVTETVGHDNREVSQHMKQQQLEQAGRRTNTHKRRGGGLADELVNGLTDLLGLFF